MTVQKEQFLIELKQLLMQAPNELKELQSSILKNIEMQGTASSLVDEITSGKINPEHRFTKDEISALINIYFESQKKDNIEADYDELYKDVFGVFQEANENITTSDLETFTFTLNGSHKHVQAISFNCTKGYFLATTYLNNTSYNSPVKPNKEIIDFLKTELMII